MLIKINEKSSCGIIGKKKHRFPNLASMKLSSYHKSLGKNVILATSWDSAFRWCYKYMEQVEIPKECVIGDNAFPKKCKVILV